MLLGGGAAYLGFKFFQEYAVALLAAWGGLALGMIAAEVAGVKGGTGPLIIAVAGAIIGGYLGRKMNRFIRSVGTAFVGSFLIARGVACYAGGYPSAMQLPESGPNKETMGLWMYLGGVVVGTLVGSVVQLYLFRDENKDDNDYLAAEDEGRICGCF